MRTMPTQQKSLMTDAMRQKLRERVRGQAVARSSKTHFPPFIVPEGYTAFVPDEKGWFELDILFYKISEKNHPSELPAGMFWYVRPFEIHARLGSSGRDILCPRSVNQNCPFCNELDKIRAKHGWKFPLPRGLRPTPYGAYYANDPESGAPIIFAWNMSKFGELLEKELAQSELDVIDFAQAIGGKRVKFRVSEDSFEGRKFLKCDKIEFKDRDDLDESVIANGPDLDACLQPLDQEALQELFYSLFQDGTCEAESEEAGTEEEADEETPRRVIGKPSAKPVAAKTKVKPAPEPEEEAEEEATEEEAEAQEEAGEENQEPEEAAEDENQEAEVAEEQEVPEGCVPCVSCQGSGTNSRGKPCPVCLSKGYLRKKAPAGKPATTQATKPVVTGTTKPIPGGRLSSPASAKPSTGKPVTKAKPAAAEPEEGEEGWGDEEDWNESN